MQHLLRRLLVVISSTNKGPVKRYIVITCDKHQMGLDLCALCAWELTKESSNASGTMSMAKAGHNCQICSMRRG